MRAVPPDYYARLEEVELEHWWHRGMLSISVSLLGERLRRPGQSLLDAGCGTGGFLRFAAGLGSFRRLCGADVSAEAIGLARRRVPEAELEVAALHTLPFESGDFDLVVLNDVLQHVREDDVEAALTELRRVLRPDGVLLVRTNGTLRARREREDWRAYDRRTLAADLARGGFRVERLTHANAVLSLFGAARGRAPSAPTSERHGIPARAGRMATAIGARLLALEARYLARPDRGLPFGHTLLAVAAPDGGPPGRSASGFVGREASRYDREYVLDSAGGRIVRARVTAVIRLLGDEPGRVLDVGMGGGRLLAELDRRGWTVSGVDGSTTMVGLTTERLPHRSAALVLGDAEALPFPDAAFDAVVATGVLEYVRDLPRALGEAARVTRPGGLVVVSFPNDLAPYSLARHLAWYPAVQVAKRLVRTGRPAPRRAIRISVRRLGSLLEAAGLPVETVVRLGARPLPRRLAERLDGSEALPMRVLATQVVLAARRNEGARA